MTPPAGPTVRRARTGRTVTLCLSAALLALLAACGSYTKKDFIARADAICSSTLRATRAVAPPTFGGGSGQLASVAAYLAKVVPLVRSEAGQLQALRRPGAAAADQVTLTRFLAAFTREAGDYAALAAAAQRGDRLGVASAEGVLRVSPAASLAARYGLRACGSAGATIA